MAILLFIRIRYIYICIYISPFTEQCENIPQILFVLKNITKYDVYNIEKLNKNNIRYENETIHRPYNYIKAF